MNKRKIISLFVAGAMALSLISSLGTPSIPVQAGGPVEDGLVAYWTFDDNYEETASGIGTSLGANDLTYTEGVYGKAAVFNGTDNYLIVDADPVLNLGNSRDDNNDNFTISAWINLGDSKYSSKYILDKGNNSEWSKGDNFYWTNPYRLRIDVCEPMVDLSNNFQDTSTDESYITEGECTTRGKHVEGQEWFLLTVTYDGKRVKIYRDNEVLTQSNYTNGIAYNDEELYIGVDNSLSYYFKGAMDDLRLYTKTLSFEEVGELYQKGLKSNKELVEPTKQLVAYYPFDDNMKDKSTFSNEAENVAVGGTTKYIVGKNGKAITISDGNYIKVPAADQLNFDTEFTASFWVKLNEDIEDNSYPVLYRQNPSNTDDNDNDPTYKLYITTWGEMNYTEFNIHTTVYNPDSWVPEYGQDIRTYIDYSKKKIKSSDWMHYTAAYKNGELKTYINGVLQVTSDKSDLVNISNASGNLLIGYDGETFINGALDELKIYNNCLSATDVEKEYKRVDTISLNKTDAGKVKELGKGTSYTIDSILLNDGDTDDATEIKLKNKNITFKTSDKRILTVTTGGKITGVKPGNAKLTITYGCHSVTYKVVVN